SGMMDLFHYRQPLLAGDLLRAEPVAHRLAEDLRPSARQRAKSRLFEPFKCARDGESGQAGQIFDLHRSERLDVECRGNAPDGGEHFEIEFERQLRMQPAYDVNLRRPLAGRFRSPVTDLLHIVAVSSRFVRSLRKRTELAPVDADVRMVDVPVDVEEDPPAVLPLIRQCGELPDRNQVGILKQKKCIFVRKANTVMGFCGYFLKILHFYFSPESGICFPHRLKRSPSIPSWSRTFPTTKLTISSTVCGCP